MMPDFIFGLTPGDLIWDSETYPNTYTVGFYHTVTGREWIFEISPRVNDVHRLIAFIDVAATQCRLVGFNSIGFDYPILHMIYKSYGIVTCNDIYQKAMSIIFGGSFPHMVWENEWVLPQVDLYKIHHFDNKARATSLKVLEFNMQMDKIEDLPFDVGIHLNHDQIDTLIEYMMYDIESTHLFYKKSTDQIRFREELSVKYGKNFVNHNDTKIGKDYLIMKLEEQEPGCCYTYVDGKRVMRQTPRQQIRIADVLLPYIGFQHSEFKRIHDWFKKAVIVNTRSEVTGLDCTIDGFHYAFGTGGIHGSVESQIVTSDDEYIIEDWDVASYYPNLAIVNQFHPEHLGNTFCDIYKEMYEQRKTYPKGSPENAMLKLALNGTYGDSNSEYSPFYDPQFTMAITVNGQLLLCMLAEALRHHNLQMIQINTDGLTVRYHRSLKEWVHSVASWWETLTGLTLEHCEYSRMFIRDVNNYIAEHPNGKLKRKGAYDYDLGWHQNHSALVVKKAAEANLVHGADVKHFIESHTDVYDFMLRTKVPRNSKLEWGGDIMPNIVRYYVSTDGDILEKVMPPAGPVGAYKRANGLTDDYYFSVLREVGDEWDERIHTKNKSKYEERRTAYHQGYTVVICNDLNEHDFSDINYDYYVKETEKLINVFDRG